MLKEAFPDGIKRRGFSDLKEVAKLEKESALAKPDKKKEIAAEIRKLGARKGVDSPL